MKKRTPRWVSVRDFKGDAWLRRIFVEVTEDGKYRCVHTADEEKYIAGDTYDTCTWLCMKEVGHIKLFGQNIFLEDL